MTSPQSEGCEGRRILSGFQRSSPSCLGLVAVAHPFNLSLLAVFGATPVSGFPLKLPHSVSLRGNEVLGVAFMTVSENVGLGF